jgi:hypothetical protein
MSTQSEKQRQNSERDERMQSLVGDFMLKKYWSYDDVILHHNGLTQYDHGARINYAKPFFYQSIHPGARHNPTDGYLTLNHVHSASEEFKKVEYMGSSKPFEGSLAGVLRVQNFTLWEIFNRFARNDPFADVCIGFHSTNFKGHLENILLNGLNPAMSQAGRFGVGAYVATDAALSLDGYSTLFTTPLYLDPQGNSCIDSYKIVTLFLCDKGRVTRFNEFAKSGMIPTGYGSFVDNLRQPSVLCLQEYERLCPAYVMIYRLALPEVDEGDLQYDVECALQKHTLPDTSGKWWQASESIASSVLTAMTGI